MTEHRAMVLAAVHPAADSLAGKEPSMTIVKLVDGAGISIVAALVSFQTGMDALSTSERLAFSKNGLLEPDAVGDVR